MTIDYNILKKMFPSNEYDLGFLKKNDIKFLCNSPVKLYPIDDEIDLKKYKIGLVIIKKTETYDYSVFQDIKQIFLKNNFNYSYFVWERINLKNAAILAGLGQYGKNQLIYNYKFGFNIHIAVILLPFYLTNLPIRKKPKWNYLKQCQNCNDCAMHCPVKAIHIDSVPHWVDTFLCDNFCHFGNDKNIPSIKQFWGKKIITPPIPDDILKDINTFKDCHEKIGLDIHRSYIINNQEVYIQFPVCHECYSQPKCSKYNGQYPYQQLEMKVIPKK